MALFAAFSNDATTDIVTVEEGPDGTLVVPDGNHLFGGDMQRSGSDLLIVNDGAPTYIVPNYFAGVSPQDLYAPNGAVLRGPMVEVLAGPEAPGLYAQQGQVVGADPIGQVEELDGAATVQRADGTRAPIGPETKIFLGDLVETGPGASLSLTFVDGTIFSLSADARMVIDELVYDPNGSDNTASFNLIQGSFVFIAGQIAPTGGMDIATPTATMGIRGTTVLVEISTIDGVVTVEVSLLRDPDGSVGVVQLFDLAGAPIAQIDATDTKWIIAGDGSAPLEVARTAEDDASDSVLIAEAVSAFQAATARVLDGGTFVTLDSRGDVVAPESELAPPPPSELDVDSIDEAPGVPETPAPPPPAAPPQNQSPTQEEGNLAPESETEFASVTPLAPSVTIAGLEDSGADSGIPGQLTAGTELDVSFAIVDEPENGSVALAADGSFTYAPDENFNGEDQFTYQVTDSDGNTGIGEVTVFVEAVNDVPDAQNTALSVAEDGTISGEIAGSDVDGDALTYSLVSAPEDGTVVLTETGAFSYTPSADFAGTDQFIVEVSDGVGGTAQSLVTITVTNLNDTPVVVSTQQDATGAAQEDVVTTASGQLVAQDADIGDTLTWSGSATGTLGAFEIDPTTGAWTYILNSEAADGLAAGETVVESFTATVTDESGASAEQTVTVTITGSNDAPVISDVVVQEDANGSLSGALSANDVDGDGPVTFSLGDTVPENGVVTISPDGQFTYTPDPDFVGVDSFSYVVEDAEGGQSTAVVSVLVTSSDSDTAPGNQEVSVSIDLEAGDSDLPGEIEVSRSPALATSVNVVLVLDWSNSVDTGDISEMVASVTQALADMAETYAGSETQVDVHLIALSDTEEVSQTFDLQDPALIETINAYDFSAGPAAPLEDIVDPAREFLETQPLDEQNYLFLVTPGDNNDIFATDNIEALDNPVENGFDLTIEGFTYGDGPGFLFNLLFSPPSTALDGPEVLADALPVEPVFAANLVDLSVGLFVDGSDQGEIANEDTAALVETDGSVKLTLADIPGIADLLGSENIITVEAGFDLDGDPETTELTLFSSKTLLIGSESAEAGRSVAQFNIEGDLTGALLALAASEPVEAIDMDNDLSNSLTLTGADILGLSDNPDSLLDALLADAPADSVTIYGDGNDTLTLQDTADGTFSASREGPVTDDDGTTLALYNYSDASGVVATVAVDADVAVTVATAQAVA